jgi:hypothetical protein
LSGIERLAPFQHAVEMPYGLRTDMFATRKIHRTRLRNLLRLGWPPLLRACGGSLAGRRVPLRRELMLRCRATPALLFAFAVPAAFSRSPVHFSRPRSSPRFPVHLAGPVRLSTYDKPSLSPLSRPPEAPDPARAPCGRALLAAGARIPTIAHRALISRQG